jgi:DDE superfamily endonuclease
LVLRRKTNSKKVCAGDKVIHIQAFHDRLRHLLRGIPECFNIDIDSKWGVYTPNRRYNLDQVPLPFVVDLKTTIEEVGVQAVRIAQNQPGLDKRFCTLQVCFRPDCQIQPKPTIIFRGKGLRISAVEKAAWDGRVHVMWQPKAWADRDVTNKWAEELFGPFCQLHHANEPSLLFCDNLESQVQENFANILQTFGCRRFLLPANCTEFLQPVDAGLGRSLKARIARELEKWLQLEENLDLWENGQLSASDKRILITKWVGNAWESLFSEGSYDTSIYFEKTGCLLTLDGSEDAKIRIQGLEEIYHPTPPDQQVVGTSIFEEPAPEPEPQPDDSVIQDD